MPVPIQVYGSIGVDELLGGWGPITQQVTGSLLYSCAHPFPLNLIMVTVTRVLLLATLRTSSLSLFFNYGVPAA